MIIFILLHIIPFVLPLDLDSIGFYIGCISYLISMFFIGMALVGFATTAVDKPVTTGIFRYTRNPMYVGFNLLTIAAILFTLNILILILGIYCIIVYHFIILNEEKFLENRFKTSYTNYKKKVRRYI